jgi:hyperosmotically inducible periplasmic protein
MKITRLLVAITITATNGFVSCSLKDADIKTDIETKLKAARDMSGITVDVKNRIATIEGQCKDDACIINCEKIAQEVNGVKTVINNLSVVPPPVAPVIVTERVSEPVTPPVADVPSELLTKQATDAVKKFPAVKVDVKNGVVTLTGKIKKNDLPKLMKDLNSLKPERIENRLTVIKKLSKKHTKHKKRSRRR